MTKRSLVALALFTAAGFASAQSSVVLFGVLDATVTHFSNKTRDAQGQQVTVGQTVLRNSGYNSSRLGFRGTEDLGGGLAASFWLEGAVNNDDGSGVAPDGFFKFDRRSTLSLSGGLGELRLGRDYTPTFWNDAIFDPMGINGAGISLVATASGYASAGSLVSRSGFSGNASYVRASNSIGYFLPPDLGGFYGQFMYAMNEKTSYEPGSLTPPTAAVASNPALATNDNARAGRYLGGRIGYASGPLDIALAAAETTIASNYFLGRTNSMDTWSLGASYDMHFMRLFGEYSSTTVKMRNSAPLPTMPGAVEPGVNGWIVGTNIPVGPGQIRFSYAAVKYDNVNQASQIYGAQEPRAGKWALGYVHNLSRRTALYATVARVSNRNGADLALGGPAYFKGNAATGTFTAQSSTGWDFGVRHAF
jgi:predicted porin